MDAFHTLVEHLEEKPVLLTVWGADIKFEDETGWQKVFQHLEKTAEEFQLDYVTIKSSFRLFLNDDELNKKVVEVVMAGGMGFSMELDHRPCCTYYLPDGKIHSIFCIFFYK